MTETESRWYHDAKLMEAHKLKSKQELVDEYHPSPEDAEKIYRSVHAREQEVNPESLGVLVWEYQAGEPEDSIPAVDNPSQAQKSLEWPH